MRHKRQAKAASFTLLEILAATTMFAVLVGALYGVFHAAFRLRERSFEKLQNAIPRSEIATVIENDLAGVLPAAGLLAGSFLGEKHESGARRSDTLEIHTASGAISEEEPWGDIQRVKYLLESPANAQAGQRLDVYDLVRSVTRNLLASTEEEPEEERLLEGVQSLQFLYYDGEDWVESWDSSAQENATPRLVKAIIGFPPDATTNLPTPSIEVVTLVAAEPVATQEAAAESGTTGGSGSQPPPAGPPSGPSQPGGTR